MEHVSGSKTIYTTRLNRVMLFINDNLSEKLSLEILAQEACFSPYHFHRIFTAIVGETPNAYINRVRLERAANMLQSNPGMSITDIAFATGFSSSAAFSRSFKQHFGCPASIWKIRQAQSSIHPVEEAPNAMQNWQFPQSRCDPLQRQTLMQRVIVKRMPAFHVAYVASQEGYRLKEVQAAWDKLCKWAFVRDLLTFEAVMLGISYDNPEITPYHKCRYYACVTVPDHIPSDDTVGIMDITAGRYAVYRFEGTAEGIQAAFRLIYAEWLPDSGYQPAHTPCYELYYVTPETHHEEIYTLDICMPVEPL
ncbi:transcriptional regulator, AraC family [Candidatus Vecturithrix granuli]|uniref:Transcriptional regulator, AraC family n=1 Tax=Vecturithrix granuli TaxID=1499967 RepID=A0A081C1C0_VECG1|nr:transcriptional regulator, AraC family [Candidatus Vecturithrix granuli]